MRPILTAISYSQALEASAPSLIPQHGSLQMKLSALTTALRFHYYLVRMAQTQPHRMRCAKTLRQHLGIAGVYRHMDILVALVAQELVRMDDPPSGHFQSTERAICGEPVKIEAVTQSLVNVERAFCTICQDEHPVSKSVRPLSC